jgi:hypothetical protein
VWHDKLKDAIAKILSVNEQENENDEFRKFCKSPEEIKKVYELCRNVPGAGHYNAIRFLRARKGDVPNAIKMLSGFMEWRARTFPLPLDEDLKFELMKGKYWCRGRDKDGKVICCVQVNKLIRGDYKNIEVAVKAMIFAFEWLGNSDLMRSPIDTWTIMLDTRGMGLEHIDHRFVAGFAEVVQERYPERLHRLIVFPAGAFVRGAWAGVRHFFDPNTAAKVVLLPDKEQILDYVDADQLNFQWGGTDEFLFDAHVYLDHFYRNDVSIVTPKGKVASSGTASPSVGSTGTTSPVKTTDNVPVKRRSSIADVFSFKAKGTSSSAEASPSSVKSGADPAAGGSNPTSPRRSSLATLFRTSSSPPKEVPKSSSTESASVNKKNV